MVKSSLMLTRRKSLKLLLAATPVAACAEAFYFEPKRLSTTRQTIFINNLPQELDGFKIVHLTDFHFKPDTDDELLTDIIAATRAENPDLIALTGDYVTDDSSALLPLLEHLQHLSAKHGVFASMGNHDGWTAPNIFYKTHFENAGIHFLINQNTQLDVNGTPLHIAGTDYVWRGNPNPQRTLRGIPEGETILALVHEPDYFDTMRAQRPIHLQLSGHTHGGQCCVPFIGYAPVKVDYGKKYVYGHYLQGDSQLFVSRGTGTSGLRVRFACPPELAILTLRALES